jgi:hypothetical protein
MGSSEGVRLQMLDPEGLRENILRTKLFSEFSKEVVSTCPQNHRVYTQMAAGAGT